MLAGLLLGFILLAQDFAPAPVASEATLTAAIGNLGSFDFATRTEGARVLRRAPAQLTVPLLERAVRENTNSYTRFRAFVLLTGSDVPAVSSRLARDMLRERDDRVRTTAYQWFERHPDPDVLPLLLEALPGETSEFVRPALTRTLAAYGDDPRVRLALVPLVSRGEDLFRGSLIDALGSFKARYALGEIGAVARLDGPLQDDAVSAIGRIGASDSVDLLANLQASAPRELQPTVSAALCLVGIDCAAREEYLRQTLEFAAANDGYQPLLRGAVHAIGLLATAGRPHALASLFEAGAVAREQARGPIALGIGVVALRNPAILLQVLEARTALDGPIDLLVQAFDLLSEDFEEEQFYSVLRREFWAAPAGSARRRVAETLIQRLEF